MERSKSARPSYIERGLEKDAAVMKVAVCCHLINQSAIGGGTVPDCLGGASGAGQCHDPFYIPHFAGEQMKALWVK